MKAKTTKQTKHADCLTSDTPVSVASIAPVFPFDRTVVSINCVYLTIISMSSAIVDDGETSISISSAINSVNDSVFSTSGTIICAASAIIVMLQRTISLPHTIIDETPPIIFGSQIIASEVQIIISATETVISGDHQTPANQRVPDGSREITISVPETIICKAKTIISVLQIRMSKRKAIISERIVFIDGLYMIIAGPDPIISGVDSIIDIHEAMMSIVETTISTTQTNFPRGDTVISAFPTSFLAAEIIILSFKKTACADEQFDLKVFLFSGYDKDSEGRLGRRYGLGEIAGRFSMPEQSIGPPNPELIANAREHDGRRGVSLKRAFYSASIADFRGSTFEQILGTLAENSSITLEHTQRNAWMEEIRILKEVTSTYEGQIYFEYAIPRMGKRIDVLLIVRAAIVIIEFKIGEKEFTSAGIDQVWDYALDLKNFHEASHARLIAPILCASRSEQTSPPIFRMPTTTGFSPPFSAALTPSALSLRES